MQTPKHVAIIMDGNGRWANERHIPRAAGHKAGVQTLRKLVEHCVSRKLEILTVYAFSSENWQRPANEVNLLMDLFMTSLKEQIRDLHKNGVKLLFIGDRSAFMKELQGAIDDAEALTAGNKGLTLIVAANYGGRWDIVSGCKKLVEKVISGELEAGSIDETLINQVLSLGHFPDPELFIRTGGEKRISNYLLWQLAYTELYFTDVLWPDFGVNEFENALKWFSKRQRRFGRTAEQVDNNA